MDKITATLLIIATYIVVIPLGAFIYIEIDALRISFFCPPEYAQEGDCYMPGWEYMPVWVSSTTGVIIAFLSVAFAYVTGFYNRRAAVKYIFVSGAIVAVPFSLVAGSFIAYLATLIAGFVFTFIVHCITRQSN